MLMFRRVGSVVTVGQRGGSFAFAPPVDIGGAFPRKPSNDPQNSCACRRHTFQSCQNFALLSVLRETREHIPWSFSDNAVRACSVRCH